MLRARFYPTLTYLVRASVPISSEQKLTFRSHRLYPRQLRTSCGRQGHNSPRLAARLHLAKHYLFSLHLDSRVLFSTCSNSSTSLQVHPATQEWKRILDLASTERRSDQMGTSLHRQTRRGHDGRLLAHELCRDAGHLEEVLGSERRSRDGTFDSSRRSRSSRSRKG